MYNSLRRKKQADDAFDRDTAKANAKGRKQNYS